MLCRNAMFDYRYTSSCVKQWWGFRLSFYLSPSFSPTPHLSVLSVGGTVKLPRPPNLLNPSVVLLMSSCRGPFFSWSGRYHWGLRTVRHSWVVTPRKYNPRKSRIIFKNYLHVIVNAYVCIYSYIGFIIIVICTRARARSLINQRCSVRSTV